MKKLLTTGPGILIAIPTLGRPVNLDWALAFKALNPPINYNINFSIRNYIDLFELLKLTSDLLHILYLFNNTYPKSNN